MDVTDRDLRESERAELDRVMSIVEQLPHQALLKIIRHMLRTGLYFRRTKDVEAVVSALRSLFTVVRHREDERYQKHLHEAQVDRDHSEPVDPETVLLKLRRSG